MNKVNVKKYAATKEASAANGRLIRASLYPEDELLEVTPKNFRIRKKELDHAQRMKNLSKKKAGLL